MPSWIASGYPYTATYTHLDMMASVVGSSANNSFAYDADGERTLVRDRLASVYTISLRDVSGHDIRELTYTPSTQTWAWKKDTIYRGGALLASVGAAEGIRQYHLDHLGTPRLVTDRCGAQDALFNYYPFGQEILAAGSQDATERMRFTGHERDLVSLTSTSATSTTCTRGTTARVWEVLVGRSGAGRPGSPALLEPLRLRPWQSDAVFGSNWDAGGGQELRGLRRRPALRPNCHPRGQERRAEERAILAHLPGAEPSSRAFQ